MNQIITPKDVTAVIKSFLEVNAGDEATESLILAIGAELLDVSPDAMLEMCNADTERNPFHNL